MDSDGRGDQSRQQRRTTGKPEGCRGRCERQAFPGGADNGPGFAIPIDDAREVIDEIIKTGRVQRSWIGVTLQEVTSKTDDPNQLGAVIADIDPLSPAAESGLRAGDVLLSIDGTPTDARYVEALPAVRKMIADLPVDTKVMAKIQRGAETVDIPVTPIEKSDVRGEEVEFEEWGFTASDVTPSIARMTQLPSTKGMFISGSQVGGVAANAGLRQGDIVLKVDGKELANMAEFKQSYKERVESKQALVLFEVKSGALTRFVLVKQMEGGGTPSPEETRMTEAAPMKNKWSIAFGAVFTVAACAAWGQPMPASIVEDVYARISPAVCIVSYSSEITNPNTGQSSKRNTRALGLIVTADGLVLAHGHMQVDDSEPFNIKVTVGTGDQEKEYDAKLLKKPEDVPAS